MLASFYGLGKALAQKRTENDSIVVPSKDLHQSKLVKQPSEEKIMVPFRHLDLTEKFKEQYKSNDAEMKLNVMGQLYEEIDFACNKSCKYDHKCADRPGFNSFMA